MPGLPDKWIINEGRDDGNASMIRGGDKSIQRRLDIIGALGHEAKTHNLLKQTMPIRDKMKTACDTYNDAQQVLATAQREYINVLDECADELDLLINKHLGLIP